MLNHFKVLLALPLPIYMHETPLLTSEPLQDFVHGKSKGRSAAAVKCKLHWYPAISSLNQTEASQLISLVWIAYIHNFHFPWRCWHQYNFAFWGIIRMPSSPANEPCDFRGEPLHEETNQSVRMGGNELILLFTLSPKRAPGTKQTSPICLGKLFSFV